MFGWRSVDTQRTDGEIAAAKKVIYYAFLVAIKDGVPEEKAGILVDDSSAPPSSATPGLTVTPLPAPGKRGPGRIRFEYGDSFATHIESIRLTFAKVLVRYNPEAEPSSTPGKPQS